MKLLFLAGLVPTVACAAPVVPLTSPIGARVLLALYHGGHLKLKKPPARSLPALEAYIVTEAAFRTEVAAILSADAAKRARLAEGLRAAGQRAAVITLPEMADDPKLSAGYMGRDRFFAWLRGRGLLVGASCGAASVAGLASGQTRPFDGTLAIDTW